MSLWKIQATGKIFGMLWLPACVPNLNKCNSFNMGFLVSQCADSAPSDWIFSLDSCFRELINVDIWMLDLIGKCLHFLVLAERGTKAPIVED